MQVITKSKQMPVGEQVVATIGMFDGVHLGHRTLIEQLRSEGEASSMKTAVITFANHPQNVLRGASLKMIMPLESRLKTIENLGIDYVILMDFTRELAQLTSTQYLKLLHDDFAVKKLVVGFNHHFGHDRSEGFADYVVNGKKVGVELTLAKEYKGEFAPVSSSIIRTLISEGKVKEAGDRLGGRFTISGIVVHGFANGRKIGFPTANVGNRSENQLLPLRGAYAVRALVRGEWHDAMANVGVRPTIDNGDKKESVEVNIFNFDDDIYDEVITVQFVAFLRPEAHLGSLSALKEQLAHDRTSAQTLLQEKTKLK